MNARPTINAFYDNTIKTKAANAYYKWPSDNKNLKNNKYTDVTHLFTIITIFH